jgi:Ricin-type beta-trefoil lectin domain-like
MASWVSFMSMAKAGSVINVAGGSGAPGTQLIVWPTPLTGTTPDELWEWQADPNGSGYFLIVSTINGLVIDVRDAATAPGTPIQTWTQNLTDAQLWEFVPDPAGSGYSSIQSKLSSPGNPLVINVAGGVAEPGTHLILWPAPPAGPTANELWVAVATLPPPPPPPPPAMQWNITGRHYPNNENDWPIGAPFNGLDFAVANNSGSISAQSAEPGNNGIYSVTTTPGTVLTLGANWVAAGYVIVTSGGAYTSQDINGSPATVYVQSPNVL